MNFKLKRLGLTLVLTGVVSLTLSACGGGGGGGVVGGGTIGQPPPVVNTDIALSGVVADGLIQGAKVCYDLNDNGVCDSGEPVSANTGVDGKYDLTVPLADAGKHAVIALVPVGAVDSDTGAVATAYVMKAPAQTDTSKSVFVSPITTIVQDIMKASGATDPTAAIAQVKTQLGMAGSPLDNFIAQKASSDPAVVADASRTGNIAQVVTAITQEVARIADTASVPTDSKQILISGVVLNSLPSLAATAANQGTATPVITAATLVANQNITTSTVAVQAQVAVTISTATSETPTVSTGTFALLRDFTYTDANNWNYRVFSGDSVLQADGFKYANDVRVSKKAGVVQSYNRDAAYFDAAANKWYECPSDGYQAIHYTDATAAADSMSKYCNTYTSTSKRVDESIAGLTMEAVVNKIRSSGLPRGQGTYATWGPATTTLANPAATFPADSVLRYQVTTDTATPEGQSLSAKVRVFKNTATPNFIDWPFATTLDEMVQYYPGSFNGASPNGANTDGLRDMPDESVTDPTLQKIKNYRVAYQATSATAGNVRFYLCRRNASNGFTNCTTADSQVLFDTTYSIETKGDARTLKFASFPADNEAYWKYRRMYVERAGTVFYGFKDILQTITSIRLSTAAWAALRDQLPGVTAHTDPVAPVPTDAASWLRDMRENSFGTDTFTVRLINSTVTSATGGDFSEVRRNSSNGVIQNFARNTLYWNGSAWKDGDGTDNQCKSNGILLGTFNLSPRTSLFCGLFGSAASSFDVDISGKGIATTLAEMRKYGSYDNGNDYGNYGPTTVPTNTYYATFNSAVFPSGAKLRYQSDSVTQTADSFVYANQLTGVSNAIAVGTPAVALPNFTSLTSIFTGLPSPNGGNTVGVYSYNDNATPVAGTTAQKRVRVSFQSTSGAAGNASFYICGQSSTTGFTVNCAPILSTSYTIAAQGGKSVLRFATLPDVMTVQGGFDRSFVEHAGAVYAMGKGVLGSKSYSQRLNFAAYNSIFSGIFGVTLPAYTNAP